MSEEKKPKHSGGPLKRSGELAESWNESIGKGIDNIPATQLPTKRTVLQRYRNLRIEHPPLEVIKLSEMIADEVLFIWNKARVPTKTRKNCVRQIISVVEEWNQFSHRRANRTADNYQASLDQLLDIAPKPRGNIICNILYI